MSRRREAAAVSVRLRRLWLGEVPRTPTLANSDFAGVTHDVELRRVGSTLQLLTPFDFGSGDPFAGPFGDWLRTRTRELSGGAVDELAWEPAEERGPVRRARTSDLDVYTPGDPVLDDYPEVLARLRRRLPAAAAPPAREAVEALRLVAVSRHRLWFAAPTAHARDAIGAVPGARAALVAAVQAVQGHDVPLYRVVVDPLYRAKSLLLTFPVV